MFHVKQSEHIDRLIRLAAEVGVELTHEQAQTLLAHLDMTIEENRTQNLTAISTIDEGVRLHIVDSLSVLPRLGGVHDPVVDLGSGAGYPGIPIAVAGSASVWMLEPRTRRAEFLSRVVEKLGLSNAQVIRAHAEQLAVTDLAGTFSAVTARAVSSLPALVELAAPLLRLDGELLAMKGAVEQGELDRGDRVGTLTGMDRVAVDRFALPEVGEARSLVVYRKTGESSVALPRGSGKAQKRPLA